MGLEAREVIALGSARDESFAQIARRLDRPTSTISREVERAGGRDGYRATVAQRAATVRARRPKIRKLVEHPELAAIVEAGLVQRWSPAEIAARLPLDHPDEAVLRVSHETIYTSLYLLGRGGLKRELISALRSGRLRRRPRRRGETAKRANVLGDITPVSARPPEASDRSVPGHWEGDLVRHEALLNRVVMKGHHLWSVAAGW